MAYGDDEAVGPATVTADVERHPHVADRPGAFAPEDERPPVDRRNLKGEGAILFSPHLAEQAGEPPFTAEARQSSDCRFEDGGHAASIGAARPLVRAAWGEKMKGPAAVGKSGAASSLSGCTRMPTMAGRPWR